MSDTRRELSESTSQMPSNQSPKTVWAYRVHHCKPVAVRLFTKLANAVPDELRLVLAFNNKSESDQAVLDQWRALLKNIPRQVEIVTLPDDEVKQKYPVFDGAWQHGQIHMTEIGARLHYDFDHLWMADHDLEFSGDFNAFWEIVRHDPRDHLTAWVRHHDVEPDWAWWPVVPAERRLWKSFMPLVRCSRRLLQHLEKVLTSGTVYFCEAMLPGETVAQFGELALGELPVTTFQHKYYRYSPPLCEDERSLIDATPQFRWWHPVKE